MALDHTCRQVCSVMRVHSWNGAADSSELGLGNDLGDDSPTDKS